MAEYSSEGDHTLVVGNQNMVKGDLKSSILPPLIGIPAGIISTFLNNKFPDRGYLSSEYYIGTAFEFQLIVISSFLFGFALFFIESKRFETSLRDMILGGVICNLIFMFMAYGHGYFPLLLIFYLQWLWMCYFWQKKLIPAFRYSIWLSFGLLCGAIAGSIIALSMF
ncbi:MAG TPA: hypothetical protein QF644_01945 [Candidatus Poseidoniaceae archaeon]|nr:hypothetical protein [Candidatus Poseidoniaceae archaeon]